MVTSNNLLTKIPEILTIGPQELVRASCSAPLMKSVWTADPSRANQSLAPKDGELELKELVLHMAAIWTWEL